MNDLDEALVRADAAIPEVYGLLEYGGETKDKGADFLAQLNEALPRQKQSCSGSAQLCRR